MTWWSITFGVIAVAFIVVGFGMLIPGGDADLRARAVGRAGSVPGGSDAPAGWGPW